MLSGNDEAIDLSDEEYDRAKQKFIDDMKTSMGPVDGDVIRRVRPKTRGLMIVYILQDQKCKKSKDGCSICQHPSFDQNHRYISIVVSFPQSQNAKPKKYILGSVALKVFEEMHG